MKVNYTYNAEQYLLKRFPNCSIMLRLSDKKKWMFNSSAAIIFDYIADNNEIQISKIVDMLYKNYIETPEVLKNDVTIFINKLEQEKIITISPLEIG